MKTNQLDEKETYAVSGKKNFLTTKSVLKSLIVIFFLSLFSFEVEATHFRYGQISWSIVSGRTVQFKVSQGWRRSAFGNPNVGNLVNSSTSLIFGDATSASIVLTVTSVNAAEDWFYGETTINHTYPASPNNFVAYFESCCRISSLQQGNNDQSFKVISNVSFGAGNNSPVSAMPPMVNVGVNANPATFILAASDPDGNTLSYRLSTPAEMGAAGLTNPVGLTIDPSTGLVSWSTVGKTIGHLYMVQFTVEDGQGGSIAVDLILRIIQQTNPPSFDYSVTPPNGHVYEIQPGQALCFDVKALDNDPGDNVLLSAVGLPIGSTTLPVLPTSGNPVQTTFCWTPNNGQLGAVVVNFTAQDNGGTQVNSSVTIIVSLDPVFDVPPTPPLNSETCLTPGQAYQTQIQAHSPDPLVTVQLTGATIPGTATLAPALPTPAGNSTSTTLDWTPAGSDWGPNTLTFTATDNLTHFTNHSFQLIVNTATVITSVSPATSVNVGNLYSYDIVANDPDVAFGDVVTIAGSYPLWMTLTPTGTGTATLSGTPGPGDAGVHSITIYAEDIYHHCGPIASQNFSLVVCDLQTTATVGTIQCYGGTACVTVTASGGTPPYSGDGEHCGFGVGNHSITVTDANGCSSTFEFTLTEPDKLTVTTSSTPSSGADGTATAVPNGGTPPYSYLWSDAQSTDVAVGLAAGFYTVVVEDANGCTTNSTVEVENACSLDPPGPISGPDGVCKKQTGVVFCVTPNPFATSYVWLLPAGIIATGPTTGPCITVKVHSKFKGGFVCAQAVTPCGITASACKNVVLIKKDPFTPGFITGPSNLCPNDIATYSIVPVPHAVSYYWTEEHMTILSGQGTTSVVVQTDANFNNGNVKVKAINCKGKSGNRTIHVTSNGCKLSSESIFTEELNEEGISQISVYPNPATGKATIDFNSLHAGKIMIEMNDLLGRRALSLNETIVEGYNKFDISLGEVPQGIYMISVRSENGINNVVHLIVE